MKTRKFLSLTLALSLTASLTVPALAAEEVADDGFVTANVNELTANPIDPEMLEAMPIPVPAEDDLMSDPDFDEEYEDEEFDYYTFWKEQVEEYRAAHPGELEKVDINELLIRQGFSDPMTAFMESREYTTEDEALTDLYIDYVSDKQWAEHVHQLAEERRAEYPELWASFDDAAYFAENYSEWYDTGVEFMRTHGLWTYDEFVDNLFMEYVDSQMPNDWEDWTPDLSLSVNGYNQWDSSIYAENGVSYLPADELNAILGTDYTEDTPIRNAALEQGWDVAWNAKTNQVILFNKAQITDGWDFTNFDAMLNQILKSAKYEKNKPLHTKQTANITLTRFNTLDGNETNSIKITSDVVMQGNTLNLTLNADLAQLFQMLPQSTLNELELQMPKLTFQNLKTLLSGCKVQILLNMEEGALYVNAPILSLLDENITDKTWFYWDVSKYCSASTLDTMWDMMAGNWNTADYLYTTLFDYVKNNEYGYYNMDMYQQVGTALSVIMGNEAVTEKNGTYTWKMNISTLDKMLKTMTNSIAIAQGLSEEELEQLSACLPSMSNIFKEYQFVMTVDKNGRTTASFAMRLNAEGIASMVASSMSGYGNVLAVIGGADGPTSMFLTGGLNCLLSAFDFRVDAKGEGTAKHAASTAEVHVKNQFKVEIKATADQVNDTPSIMTTLPTDAMILDADLLF